ncbi:GIY-YIG nuclease family protein [Silvimonas iriomotensis]|uniref:GIY-YIG domain-containing protein n=1 Tax=Silvimonas iriomotensis TaxID=449662 RepID=A0ABQ2PEU6_9NEIS|nr:GIY-YIG nuclease family protein [Silvimonas iriomotensis]GGP23912.1 hypothetical protein GCM10010970_39120 [Silvimonas iriomotensis]
MQPVTDGASAPWFVYLIECRNGSLYTGISNDVAARYLAHASGKGARYTRANPPVRLLAVLVCTDRAEASRQEYAIKKLAPKAKRALCAAHPPDSALLARLAGAAD